MVKSVLLLFLTSLLSFHASARERDFNFRKDRPRLRGNERSERVNRVNFGRLNFGGNGCPANTMRVAFAPDNLSFSILFDQFVAQIGEGRNGMDAMTCNAIIPIELPDNMQMEITRVDFRGFVSLPQGTVANLTSMFNFAGPGGDRDRMNLRFNFAGPVQDNYDISTDAMNAAGGVQQSELSPCGGTVQLRVMNQLRVQSRSRAGEAAQVTIDSIDGSGNAIYFVNWRACQRENGPGNGSHNGGPGFGGGGRGPGGPGGPGPGPGRGPGGRR